MKPVAITSEDIVSTNIPITETIWSSTETYAIGDQRYKGVFLYESAKDGNIGKDPDLYAGGVNVNNDWLNAGFAPIADPYWLIVGMINRMKVWDGYLSTCSTNPLIIDQIIQKPYVGTLYFLGVVASTAQAIVLDSLGTALWDSGTLDLYYGLDLVDDYYDWFFSEPPDPRSKFSIELGLITGSSDKIRILLSSPGTVSVGKISPGSSKDIGRTQKGMDDGALDFSKDIPDDFGDRYLKQGNYAPDINAVIRVKTEESDAIVNFLNSMRATGGVYDLNQGPISYQSYIIYGVLEEWRRTFVGINDMIIKFRVTGLI